MANRFLSNININDEYTLPSADGDADQIIQTDGAGNLSFVDLSSIEGASSNFVYFEVKNETGSTINKGKGVMAVGTDGNSGHILIDEMVADGSIESKYFLGVLETTVANGGFARVISFGQLDQFDTRGQNGETWNDGDVLWCDPDSAGDFTITEPDGPNVKIAAAFILNSSTNGKIQVRVQANEGIHDLHDTKITSQVDGDVLVWDETTGVWFNDSTLNVDYTAGNVGIGTTSPQTKLDVIGGSDYQTINIGESKTDNDVKRSGITFTHYDTDQPEVTLINSYIDSNISYVSIGGSSGAQVATENIRFYTAANTTTLSGTERMRINSSGNVGIGQINPAYKLDVNGTGSFSSTLTAQTNMYLGGLIYHSGDTNTFFGFPSNDTFKIRTNSSDRMYINSSGNVGIGTTSPNAKLDVVGKVKASGLDIDGTGNADTTFITYTRTDLTQPASMIYDGTGGFKFNANGLIYSFTDNTGLGIGTTSPRSKLHVEGVTGSVPALGAAASAAQIGGSTYGTLFSTLTSGTGVIQQGRSDGAALTFPLLINPNGGNVGIGETNPAQKLHVIGNSEITGDIFLGRYIFHNDDNNTWLGFPLADTISFRTNGSDRMYINSSGNVGIGTTSPTSRLHVKQTLASPSAPMVYFEADRGPSAYGAVNVRVDNLDYGSGMRFYKSGIYDSNAVSFYNGASSVGNININTSSTSYNTTSDYRLKENVTSITDGITRVKQLEPRRFNFIGDTSIVDGFLAHEAKEVVPEAVTGEKDEVLPNGEPVYQGIDQAKLVPLLTAALQEAVAKIEDLETRIQTLENK